MSKRLAAGLMAAAVLAAPAAAGAHVTLQPREAPAGGFTRLNVRVPNEKDDQGTTKVDVQMPDGFAFLSYEPVPGWKVKIKREKLDKPIEIEPGFEVAEQITRVTFVGDGKQGIIEPGQFRDFGLSVRVPSGEAGDKLTFKSLQTYEKGEVVRWIGPEDSEKPAPTVTLLEAAGHGAAAGHGKDKAATDEIAVQGATASGGDDDGNGLAVVALIVGALGLIAGVIALLGGRRRAGATA